jgi:DNA-binding NarL/FixJ family response regulator
MGAVGEGRTAMARLLIVDDEHTLVQALRETLTHHLPELVIETAGTLTEAITLLTSHAPTYYTAVLLDLNLPETHGYSLDALHRIWELGLPNKKIVFTGATDEKQQDVAKRYADTYLLKGTTRSADLVRVIREAVGGTSYA